MELAGALEAIGVKNTTAIKTAESIIGGVQAAVPWVGAGLAFFQNMLGRGAADPNPFEDIKNQLNAIQQTVEGVRSDIVELKTAILAEITESSRIAADIEKAIEIAKQIEPIRHAARNAERYAEEGTDEWLRRFEDSVDDAITAMNILLSPAYYQRVYDERLAFRTSYCGPIEPPNDSGVVFDYVPLLSVVMEGIATCLIIMRLDEPERYAELYKTEIQYYVERLIDIHNRIAGGIVALPSPLRSRYPLKRVRNETDKEEVNLQKWRDDGAQCGAIEVYSTKTLIDRFEHERELDFGGDGFREIYSSATFYDYGKKMWNFINGFNVLFRRQCTFAQQKLYESIGLSNLLSIIDKLSSLVSLDSADIFGRIDGRWRKIAFRELCGIFGAERKNDLRMRSMGNPLSLRGDFAEPAATVLARGYFETPVKAALSIRRVCINEVIHLKETREINGVHYYTYSELGRTP